MLWEIMFIIGAFIAAVVAIADAVRDGVRKRRRDKRRVEYISRSVADRCDPWIPWPSHGDRDRRGGAAGLGREKKR